MLRNLAILIILIHSMSVLPTVYSGWQRSSNEPVLSPGSPGSFDSYGVTDPHIVSVGSEWRMYYTAHSGESGSTIALATSIDGIAWTRQGVVFEPSAPGFFDSVAVKDPCVILDNGGYRLWYSGFDGSNWRIGQAVSLDGLIWQRFPGADSTGAAFPLHATPDRFDHQNAESPFVVRIGDSYTMVYEGYVDSRRLFIGMAESNDGNGWSKVDGTGELHSILSPGPHGFDDDGVGAPHLIFDEESHQFRLFYTALHYCVTRPIHSIGYATSRDGRDWIRHGPILSRSYMLRFDALDVFDPAIARDDDRYLLYYSGSNDLTKAIGRAESDARSVTYETSTVDFRDVLPGSFNEQTIELTNTGAEAVTITSLSASQPEFDWIDTPDVPLIFYPNARLPLTVRFTPTRSDSYSADATVMLAETSSPVRFDLRGRGSFVAVRMDRRIYQTGDSLHATLSVKGPPYKTDLDVYLVFEAAGAFYSFPGWNAGVIPLSLSVEPNFLIENVEFLTLDITPDIPDESYAFWAASVNHTSGDVAVSVDRFSTAVQFQETSGPALDRWLADHPDAVILDVRTEDEYCPRHLPDSILIPHDAFDSGAVDQLSKDTEYLVVCSNGIRSRYVIDILLAEGFRYLWYLRDGLSLYSGPYEGCR